VRISERRWSEWRWSVGVLCLALLLPVAIHAQEDDLLLQARLLRAANSEESSGDLVAAEETLRRLMDQRPTSTGGILALERVLRAQNRIREILPFAEQYVHIEPDASGPRLVQLRAFTELDDENALEDAAEDWMDSAGSFAEPYREVSIVFARVFGPERALSVLRRGRTELGRPSLFAMEAGDLLKDLAADLPEGSADRRQALAEIIRLGIEWDGADVRESLAAFAREFPDAPQLDELAVTLAVQLDADGDREGARSLLAGVPGPRSALERGYLYLAAGEFVPGRGALQDALAGVAPGVATELIALLDLLDQLEGESLAALMRSAALAHQGRTDAGLSELDLAIDAVPRDQRPLLLAMGARIADAGSAPEKAADFRGRIVRDHPYSVEVPEATLELARFKGATPAGVDEAIRLLEDLILSQPNSAIVPTARRELQRIQRGTDS